MDAEWWERWVYGSEPDGKGWSDDHRFPGHATAAGPALAVFDGKLHCVHRGSGSDGRLWHTTFDGTRWSTDTLLPGHASSAGPALAVYQNRLHLVHRGSGSDTSPWHATYDGNRWSTDTRLPAHYSLEAGLAVFDSKRPGSVDPGGRGGPS
ncbi:hypothetical protein [Streptomyces sp. NPDC002287]